MRNKRALSWLYTNTMYPERCNSEQIIMAIEIAETEMRERAIDAYIQSCEYMEEGMCGAREFHGTILDSPDFCRGKDCPSVAKFRKLLDNDKTE